MYSRGATILEICMGMMIILPAFAVIVAISAYLSSVKSARNISLELTRSVDMSMLVTTMGNQDAFVNPSKLVWEDELPILAEKVFRQMDNFSIPEGAKKAVVFVAFDIAVHNQTGVAKSADLQIPWDTLKTMDGKRPTIVPHGDRELFRGSELDRTLLPIKSLVDTMRTQYLTTKLGHVFRFAIPAGVRGVEQVAYYGSSHIYRPDHGTGEGWSNLDVHSNYLRKAPIVAVTVQIDLTETRTGKLLSTVGNLGCSIIGVDANDCRVRLPLNLRVGSSKFIEPRNVL